VISKSGGNELHGGIFEYFRNSALDSRNFFDGAKKTPLRLNQFGGSVGGPIVKDKLFFFLDYSESLFSQPSTSFGFHTIPLAERGGNFAAICTAGFTGGVCNNPAQQLYDPASSANPASRTPFLNNLIPTGRFSNAAKNIINSQFYPAAPVTTNTSQFKTNSYQGDLKIDYMPSSKDHVMGRWSQQFITAPLSNSILLLGDSDRTFPLKNFVVDETHTFSSTLLNDARVGFAYFPVTEGFSNPTGQNLPTTFGIAGVTSTFLPNISVSNAGTLLDPIGNNDLVQSFHDTTLQFEDTMTWTHEKHIIHFGFQGYKYIMNDLYPGNAGLAGQFTFNGQFTGNTGTSGGNGIADFLLGLPEDVQQGNGGGGNKYLRNGLWSVFGQDNWRIKSNLTLNLGLRYELTTARTTKNGQDVNFNLITGVPTVGFGYNTYKGIDNFQPRLGLAWEPKWGGALTRNTVVRAGYAISTFMEANGVNNLPYQNPPFIQAHEVNFSGQALPGSTLDQGFSNFPASACTVAALQALSPACIQGATLHLTNPNLMPAVDQQWNLTIQRQLGSRTSLSIGYVGNKIDHMSDIFIFNQKVLNSNGTTSPGPFAQPLLTCCGVNAPTIRFNDSSGIQRYNALQMTLAQRQWKGLEFQTNYTWSKCLNNSLGYFGPFGDEEALPGTTSQTGFSFFFQNAYNAKGDYGRCIADAAGLFNGFMTYDLPFGKGKLFAADATNLVNTIIGGWSLGSAFTFHTGFAITALGPDSSGTGSASPRADCPAGVSQEGSGKIVPLDPLNPNPKDNRGLQFWNPVSALPGQTGHFGTCGIGSFRGPGLATADLNLSKHIQLGERASVEAMAQFINVTNTPILGRPSFFQGTNPATSNFGVITSANPGRQVQFGMRFVF
jgi:hypothetical protein